MGRRELNPADAERRAQKKKAKQQNAKQRKEGREVRQLISDPTALRKEIKRFDDLALEGELDAASLRHKKSLEFHLRAVLEKEAAAGRGGGGAGSSRSLCPELPRLEAPFPARVGQQSRSERPTIWRAFACGALTMGIEI